MYNMKKYALILILISLFNFLSFSEKRVDEPSWVYLKKAENLKEKGEYSEAVLIARKAKEVHVKEELEKFYEEIREREKEKTDYEIRKIVEAKRTELMQNDTFPDYYELMGDLYVLTNFLKEAEREYRKAIEQKKSFEYPKKLLELKYKLCDVYEKEQNYETADIVYKEIVEGYLKRKDNDFWKRLKGYVAQDSSLTRIFRLYREDGIEYYKAFYKIGRRSAILQRPDDALFYLANAGVILMTFNSGFIKKLDFHFQYSGPVDFLPYTVKNNLEENLNGKGSSFSEMLFFIGYANKLKNKDKIKDFYYDLALKFSKGTKLESELKNRIKYLSVDKNHFLSYEELLD